MRRIWKAAAIALLAFAIWTPAASARAVQGGVVVVQPYSRVYYGPGFYGGWYGPGWWYNPWYGPYGGPRYYRRPNAGEVKIITKYKGDSIYVDGGYAGVTGKLKAFRLRAGTHTIKLRDTRGHTFYQERITVIAGKTLKLRPDYRG